MKGIGFPTALSFRLAARAAAYEARGALLRGLPIGLLTTPEAFTGVPRGGSPEGGLPMEDVRRISARGFGVDAPLREVSELLLNESGAELTEVECWSFDLGTARFTSTFRF